jgi:hypothetical protein
MFLVDEMVKNLPRYIQEITQINQIPIAKLVPTFAGKGCRVVSATDSNGRILCFLDRNRYRFFQVAPKFYSRG